MAVTKIMDIGGNETVVNEQGSPVRKVAEYHIDCADDREVLKPGAKDAERLIYKDWWLVDQTTRVALGGSQVMVFSKDRNEWCPLANPANCV